MSVFQAFDSTLVMPSTASLTAESFRKLGQVATPAMIVIMIFLLLFLALFLMFSYYIACFLAHCSMLD